MDTRDTTLPLVPFIVKNWADPYNVLQVRDNCLKSSIESHFRAQEQIRRLYDIISRIRGETDVNAGRYKQVLKEG